MVSRLLNASPELKILASSRETLGVKGEASYPVPSLELPDIKHLPVMDQLSQYEAVRLFIDRALLVSSHFVVDKDNAPFIAQICYRLDGIPLAIELAAARVKMMSVEQISWRLDDRFRLLTGGARTALPRQQTLRALIDWSYDLLAANERLLLCRLSIFVDDWTLDAVEEICAGNGIDRYEVLDLLAQLINKSLIAMVEQSHTHETRYRMLETIRQYAARSCSSPARMIMSVKDISTIICLRPGRQTWNILVLAKSIGSPGSKANGRTCVQQWNGPWRKILREGWSSSTAWGTSSRIIGM